MCTARTDISPVLGRLWHGHGKEFPQNSHGLYGIQGDVRETLGYLLLSLYKSC